MARRRRWHCDRQSDQAEPAARCAPRKTWRTAIAIANERVFDVPPRRLLAGRTDCGADGRCQDSSLESIKGLAEEGCTDSPAAKAEIKKFDILDQGG